MKDEINDLKGEFAAIRILSTFYVRAKCWPMLGSYEAQKKTKERKQGFSADPFHCRFAWNFSISQRAIEKLKHVKIRRFV